MKRLLLFFALTAMLFTGCKKYESPSSGGGTPLPHHIDPIYHVGDYFRNDTLEGVVFLTYGAHSGLMVSLEEVRLPWCVPNYLNSETGATNPFDGWCNTNIVMSNYDLDRFPALQWSHQRNTWHMVYYDYRLITANQWFVPSSGEMSKLLQNQAAVNATLDSLGYPTLEDKVYWSSTETGTRGAAAVWMQDGQIVISDSVKSQAFYVRAIRNY